MAEFGSPSRAALLDLREERLQFEQGHRFLDEKRVLLAQEILVRLDRWENADKAVARNWQKARSALAEALGSHGLEGLQVAAGQSLSSEWRSQPDQRFLGVLLLESQLDLAADASAVTPSLRALAEAFVQLLAAQAVRAVEEVNLERLRRDYARTERRVRALEDVLLPEMRRIETDFQDRLDETDREERVGIHWFADRRSR